MVPLGRERLRGLVNRYLELPCARLLKAIGLKPNAVTVLGFLLTLVSAYLVSEGWFLPGGLVLLAAGGLDLLDGALARFTGQITQFGSLLDSVLDRLSEAALFLGLLLFYLRGPERLEIVLLFLALVGSIMVSYTRARGESLGIETRVGLMTRPERVVALALGLILNLVAVALTLVAALSFITVFQRLLHIWRRTRGG
jgi:CDP-diacylglycerol--glycerol-3-phosphate 3-phosphatidyltransferase